MTTSKPVTSSREDAAKKHRYKLKFLPDALDEYRRLDGSVRVLLKKLLAKRLDEPRVPGGELHGDLLNCYKIKLLKQGIRLVYQVEDDALVVLVLAVDKREDSAAYRSALKRRGKVAASMAKAGMTGDEPSEASPTGQVKPE